MKPSPGRIVLYVLDKGPRAGEVRPAIVTQAFPECANLRVFFDTANDRELVEEGDWRGSVKNVEPKAGEKLQPGTWHWPPRALLWAENEIAAAQAGRAP